MNIIQKEPNPSGAYPPIQLWNGTVPPETQYQVADGVELSCGGFGTLMVEDGIVVAFAPDTAAWERWQAGHTEPIPPMTTQEAMMDKLTELEYRQDLMELGLTEGGVTND